MEKRFLYIFAMLTLLGVTFVAAANFWMDADGLYAKRFFMKQAEAFASPDDFAVTRLRIDERLLKQQMLGTISRRQKPDCIVIGSSRSMLISSVFKTAPRGCARLINLAVSGGAAEDVVTFAHDVAQLPAAQRPKSIYIDLSHWSFRWGAEVSWQIRRADFFRARDYFTGTSMGVSVLPDMSIWLNLISFEYLTRSLQSFYYEGLGLDRPPFETVRRSFTLNNAPEESSILYDGSRVYSADQRAAHHHPVIKGTEVYKSSTEQPDPSVVAMYERIAGYFKDQGIEVYFFAMPYHSSLTRDGAPMSADIRRAQDVVAAWEAKGTPRVMGSFLMAQTPCQDSQMMDFMHPDAACVARIMKKN